MPATKTKTTIAEQCRRALRHRGIYIALAAIAGVALAYHFLPLNPWMQALEVWIGQNGPVGYLVFAAVYVVATLLCFPAAPLVILAGALFGFGLGLAAVMGAGMAAAIAAFMIARHVLRDHVKHYLTRYEALACVDKTLKLEGWRAVALLRLTPVLPFAVKNYFFGVSKVKFHDYVIGTALGKLPGTLILVVLGAAGRAAMAEAGPLKWAMLVAGIIATLVAGWLIARAVKPRLGLA